MDSYGLEGRPDELDLGAGQALGFDSDADGPSSRAMSDAGDERSDDDQSYGNDEPGVGAGTLRTRPPLKRALTGPEDNGQEGDLSWASETSDMQYAGSLKDQVRDRQTIYAG